MDIESLYLLIKENKVKLNSDNINEKDNRGRNLLHVAAENDDLEFIKKLLKEGTIYNGKDNAKKTPLNLATDPDVVKLLTTVRMFFKAVKDGKLTEIENCVKEEKSVVSAKETDSSTALHWAVNKGRSDIVKFLIDNSADVFQLTNKGNTALHIAVINENVDAVNLLLQHVPVDSLVEYVNMQTFKTKTSCLHIAAENGNFDLACILLSHGAIHCVENKDGATPFDLSTGDAKHILAKTNHIFDLAQNGTSELFDELNKLDCRGFDVVSHATDSNRHTIRDLISRHGEGFIKKVGDIYEVFEKRNEKKSGWKLWELKALKDKANIYLQFSDTYLKLLSADRLSKLNSSPRRHLKEGSHILNNAYSVVKQYKVLRPGVIDDNNIKMISDTLEELQFDPNLIIHSNTDKYHKGNAIFFDSSAKDSEYYKLLHGKLNKKGIEIFIDKITHQMDTSVKNLIKSIDEKLLLFPNYQLMEGVKENNLLRIEESIQMGADINLEDDDQETPLLCALKNGTAIVLKKILDNGADIQRIFQNGNSVLNIFMSKSLQHNDSAADHLLKTKYLLEYGSVYNGKNLNNESPLENASCESCKKFLKMVDACFQTAENDQLVLLEKLRTLESDDFNAVTRARNDSGNTLLQAAFRSGDEFGKQLLEMVKTHRFKASPKVEALLEKKMAKIKEFAEKLVYVADVHLAILNYLSEFGDSEINQYPWKTLHEGSRYLYYAFKVVQEYEEFEVIRQNEDIETIQETLQSLQFDSKHFTSCLKGGISNEDEIFVSKAEGAKYCMLLYTKSKKCIKEFVDIVSTSIREPAKNFLEVSKNS